ncbi:hypothetical protein LIER_36185 [Lithospermum erythrorhizon]|uniref:Uncharacterized protein n=1 Tax=Lithospermum erythrorhizon TaxID=34254 RepID=A0AAV3P3H6_LITER
MASHPPIAARYRSDPSSDTSLTSASPPQQRMIDHQLQLSPLSDSEDSPHHSTHYPMSLCSFASAFH